MKKQPFTSSCDWIAYFYENAQAVAARRKPAAKADMPAVIRETLAASLPVWQLGETSDGRRLGAAGRKFAEESDDAAFASVVEMFIREEQRHGAALGSWLDAVEIPRRKRAVGDSVFRFCRQALESFTIASSVIVMVESIALIYYAAVRRLTLCPLLKAECEQILHDEEKHIQFHCEHLALTRRRLPRALRALLSALEFAFYSGLACAVWAGHGHLFKAGGISRRRFAALCLEKFQHTRRLINPLRYEFGVNESWQAGARRTRRLSEMSAIWMR